MHVLHCTTLHDFVAQKATVAAPDAAGRLSQSIKATAAPVAGRTVADSASTASLADWATVAIPMPNAATSISSAPANSVSDVAAQSRKEQYFNNFFGFLLLPTLGAVQSSTRVALAIAGFL